MWKSLFIVLALATQTTTLGLPSGIWSGPIHKVGTANVATITSLNTVPRRGQVFIYFTKNAGSSGATTYDIYREKTQIVSIAGKVKIATVDANSWHSLYPDSGLGYSPQLSNGFYVPGSSSEDMHTVGSVILDATKGFLVWTTDVSDDYYYAVVNSDDPTVTVGVNSLTSPITETALPYNQLGYVATVVNADREEAVAWEDLSTWETAYWGYYGHRVDFYKSPAVPPVPLILGSLHGAGYGYVEPNYTGTTFAPWASIGVRDNGFVGLSDPYATSDPAYDHSYHWARYSHVQNKMVPITENRYLRYVDLMKNAAVFNIDPNRIYVEGGSLGSSAGHIALRHPDIFAAGLSEIGFAAGRFATAPAGTLMSAPAGVTWEHYASMEWVASNGYASVGVNAIPVMHQYNKDDISANPAPYPGALTAFESARLPFAATWGGHTRANPGDSNGHSAYEIDNEGSGGPWDLLRFVLNEAVPAFTNSSNSVPVGVAPAAGAPSADSIGQINANLDWQSARHPIAGGAAISDTGTTFTISLISLSGVATVNVTIWRAQSFRPGVDSIITWVTDNAQAGSAVRNSDGTVTVNGLSLSTSAVRLTITATTLGPPPPVAGGVSKSRMQLGM